MDRAQRPRRRPRRRRPVRARTLAGLALVLGAAVVVAIVLRAQSDAKDRGSRIPGLTLVRLPYGAAGNAAWSPDGSHLAVAARNGVEIRDADGHPGRLVSGPAPASARTPKTRFAWSRDGRTIRYLSEDGPGSKGGLWATELSLYGGAPRQTALGTMYALGAWSPRGWPLAFVTGPYEFGIDGKREGPAAGLWGLRHAGAKPRRLRPLTGVPSEPSMSPRGDRIAYTVDRLSRGSLFTVALDGGAPRRLVEFEHVTRPAFSPDGTEIAYVGLEFGVGSALYVIPVGGGTPRRVVTEVTGGGPAWSADGRWIAYSTPSGEIRRVHPDGSDAETIAQISGEEVTGLLFSPDDRRLAYTAYEPQESD